MSEPTRPFLGSSEKLRERLRNEIGVKWTKFDPDVIPLWIADMDFPPAEPIAEALHMAVDAYGLGYGSQPLYDSALEAFSNRYRDRFGVQLDPSRSVLTTDVVQAIYIALSTLSAPGDGIVLQPPIYPPFTGAIKETQRNMLSNRLVETPSGFQFDFDDLERLAALRDTSMLLLCNPHNPTGRVMTEAELDAVAEIAARNRVIVVADEIHSDIVYDGRTHLPFSRSAERFGTEYIILNSASKSFNLAGLRCAVAYFSSPRLREAFDTYPFHMRGAVSNLGIIGTLAAWNHSDAWLTEVLAHLDSNRHLIGRTLAREAPEIGYRAPEGTYLAWLDFTKLTEAANPAAALLDKARVGLSEGPAFGPGGAGRARLNFATTEENLADALSRIVSASRDL